MPKAFPLDWPDGSPRAQDRQSSKFKTSFTKALDVLRRELKLLGATHVLVSCNLPPARDGWPDPRSHLKSGDPGVAVYWLIARTTYVLACDAWDRIEDNLHAISLTVAADRGKARWSCSAITEKAMSAYLALPPPLAWWEIVGVPRESSLEEIRAIYRLRVKQNHPDQAADDSDRRKRNEQMSQLNLAMEAAEKEKTHVTH